VLLYSLKDVVVSTSKDIYHKAHYHFCRLMVTFTIVDFFLHYKQTFWMNRLIGDDRSSAKTTVDDTYYQKWNIFLSTKEDTATASMAWDLGIKLLWRSRLTE